MTRVLGSTAAAAALVAALAVAVAWVTTDGHGCENGCGTYERTAIEFFPIVFWIAAATAVTATAALLLSRRSR